MMAKCSYSIRVVLDDFQHSEFRMHHLSYASALEWFTFYSRAALEMESELTYKIRCVNLFSGKKCVKMLQNHPL